MFATRITRELEIDENGVEVIIGLDFLEDVNMKIEFWRGSWFRRMCLLRRKASAASRCLMAHAYAGHAKPAGVKNPPQKGDLNSDDQITPADAAIEL